MCCPGRRTPRTRNFWRRAPVTLLRYATGRRASWSRQSRCSQRLLTPPQYASMARTLGRERSTFAGRPARISRVGYESHDMVEMPGQFTVRGGIVIFFRPKRAPRAPRAVSATRWNPCASSIPISSAPVATSIRITLPSDGRAIRHRLSRHKRKNPSAVEKLSRAHSISICILTTRHACWMNLELQGAFRTLIEGAAQTWNRSKSESRMLNFRILHRRMG